MAGEGPARRLETGRSVQGTLRASLSQEGAQPWVRGFHPGGAWLPSPTGPARASVSLSVKWGRMVPAHSVVLGHSEV